MRKMFPEFFKPSQSEFDTLWNEATIVLDANCLLGLYRFSRESTQLFLQILEGYKSRVWLPYQVCQEYLRRKAEVIHSQIGLIQKLSTHSLEEQKSHLSKTFRSSHPMLDIAKLYEIVDTAISATEKLKNEASVEEYQNFCKEIDARVLELFDGKVGPKPTEQQMANWLKEGQKRAAACQPPGFLDVKGKLKAQSDEQEKPTGKILGDPYGDLLLWMQILEFGKSSPNIILVTDDAKDDWWQTIGGQTIGPRTELIKETKEHGINFYLYSGKNFVDKGQKYLGLKTDPAVLEEAISEVSENSSTTAGWALEQFEKLSMVHVQELSNKVEIENIDPGFPPGWDVVGTEVIASMAGERRSARLFMNPYICIARKNPYDLTYALSTTLQCEIVFGDRRSYPSTLSAVIQANRQNTTVAMGLHEISMRPAATGSVVSAQIRFLADGELLGSYLYRVHFI